MPGGRGGAAAAALTRSSWGGNRMGHGVNKGVGGLYQLSDCFFWGAESPRLRGGVRPFYLGW